MIKSLEGEIWKPIKGREEQYMVSNLGRVHSLDWKVKMFSENRWENRKGVLLNPSTSKCGYLRLCFRKLQNENNNKHFSVHRLVAQAFIPNPQNKPTVNHINGIKTDNRVENLEWATMSEQNIHALKEGLRVNAKGESVSSSKLTKEKVISIRVLLDSGITQRQVAEMFDVCQPTINSIHKRKTWKHI